MTSIQLINYFFQRVKAKTCIHIFMDHLMNLSSSRMLLKTNVIPLPILIINFTFLSSSINKKCVKALQTMKAIKEMSEFLASYLVKVSFQMDVATFMQSMEVYFA